VQRIRTLIHKMIELRENQDRRLTLLAVCPNSQAVLEAAVLAASRRNTPMLFAATLNQVDSDGGYTGWTQADFVARLHECAARDGWDGPLYACLDHGGPWLKDAHCRDKLPLDTTMQAVKDSIIASLEAGYALLHIDATVALDLPSGQPIAVETVVARTVELIAFAEQERERLHLPPDDYEVGTEEVQGGLVNFPDFERFLRQLQQELAARNLPGAWPCFVVARVGTDLHTTNFDAAAARQLYDLVIPYGSLIKGHYTDFADNPQAYPESGVGGANIGPELAAVEYRTLLQLSPHEKSPVQDALHGPAGEFNGVVSQVVIDSGRWQKWLRGDEVGSDFDALPPVRRTWLLETGSRYVWAKPEVVAAREALYAYLQHSMKDFDPHRYVVEQIAHSIDRYLTAFNLVNSLVWLDPKESHISAL